MALSHYIQICDGMVSLMNPLIEIVIHDIHVNRIIYIAGSLSNRKIGDPSLLDKNTLNDVEKIIYPKINFDGKLVKSTSVILEEKYLLCINSDISLFSQMQAISELMLHSFGKHQPNSLFVNDWQERLHVSIHDYVQKNNLTFEHLTARNKNALVKHLYTLGAFNEKNAADYIAKVLKLGRATVFKYLKELRGKNEYI